MLGSTLGSLLETIDRQLEDRVLDAQRESAADFRDRAVITRELGDMYLAAGNIACAEVHYIRAALLEYRAVGAEVVPDGVYSADACRVSFVAPDTMNTN
jgi:hypothetical protein